MKGDADLAAVASVLAEPARARILQALGDGRALPASVLAAEAGIAASTASGHLNKLVDANLLVVIPQGRHRYYRIAGSDVADLLEALARVAPPQTISSLKEGTRAQALRAARTCYDHLAGQLGVDLFQALLAHGAITGGDGIHRIEQATADRLSAPGKDIDYRLTQQGANELAALGIDVGRLPDGGLPVRYCIDWSEQAHHLSGAVGRKLTDRFEELKWLRRADNSRALHITADGADGLRDAFGIDVPVSGSRPRSPGRRSAAAPARLSA